MPYEISCGIHGVSCASDILDLIEKHTDGTFGLNGGRVVCPTCKRPAAILKSYKLQEGETWKCQIREVVRIPSEIPTYVPYVLFTTGEEAGIVSDGVMISYYKDTRLHGGRLKHGHGPGGPAVLGRAEVLMLIRHLVDRELVSVEDAQNALKRATT